MRIRILIITYMQIQIRTQLITLMRVDPTFQFDADPDPTGYNYGCLCVQDVYRCCEVMDVCETGKVYAVMKSKTNVGK
jgi:hypothetical protein